MGDGTGADVAGSAIADPGMGQETGAGIGATAMNVIPEAQAGAAVVFHFRHEATVVGAAGEQIGQGKPA